MSTKALVFDRDGVLTYFDVSKARAFFQPLLPLSLEEIARKWTIWGKKVGFPRTVEEETIFFQTFWASLSDELDLPAELRQKLAQFEYTSCILAYAEVCAMLHEARQRGLRIGVLSNFSLATLETSLAAVNLADFVDVACAAIVIGASKPSPEAYLTVCRLLGVLPEECLFFDDEIACVEGGRAVGMQAYLVDRQREGHALAEGVVRDLTAITQLLSLSV